MNETATIHYQIRPANPGAHLFEVRLTVSEPDPDGQRLIMAAWIPGSYMIRDFARHVVRLRAECAGRPVPVAKLDKQTWRCAPVDGPLTVVYEVYAWDLSVRGAHLDTTHGYFNGTSVFLRVVGQEARPCTVAILPPDGASYRDWRVATTLPSAGAPQYGFGLHRAAHYEELIDHPVEMGCFTLIEFEACGVPHAVAITGRHDADTERLAQDLRKLCEHHIRFFGEPAPMERYLFQVMAVGDGYGGLEHRSSTSLLCSRNDLPRRTARKMSEEYRRFLGLCSHEYFHTWNVKRIMPAAFQPYDLTREVHTTLLWAFEGITSYYDDLALVRAGIISRDDYLELLGQNVTRLLRGSGRLKQSVAESSFDAWTKYYKQDENAPNSVVSYYTKGGLIALALDLTIRRATDNARSLDDVMRALWERHGKTGIGVTEEGLERLIEEVSGVPLQPFFDQALRGTEDLPLAELLAHVGVEFHLRPAESASDKGGKPASREESELAALPSLGIRTGDDPAGAKVSNVFDGGAAQEAGISAGDVILAIDGLRATHKNLEGLLASRVPGDRIKVHLFRRDELMEFDVTLRAAPHDTCYLRQRPDLDAATQARLAAWLGGGNG